MVADDAATTVVLGDMNIAPTDDDAIPTPTSARPTSRRRSATRWPRSRASACATSRERWPDQRVFTYWDYRAGCSTRTAGCGSTSCSPADDVAERVKAAWIDRHARKGKGPSDHAPVIVDLDEAPDGDIGPVVPPPSRPAKRGTKKLPQGAP